MSPGLERKKESGGAGCSIQGCYTSKELWGRMPSVEGRKGLKKMEVLRNSPRGLAITTESQVEAR